MNKSDLIERVAAESGSTKTLSAEIVEQLLMTIKGALCTGEKVTISDFGTFSVSKRKRFVGRNPRTGEKMEIPGRTIPVFRAGRGLKSALNKN